MASQGSPSDTAPVGTVRDCGLKLLKDATSRASWVDSTTGRPTLNICNILWVDLMTVAEAVRNDKWMLLLACIIVDIIGMCSYLILLLGEVVDLWWAPLCGFFLQYMFGSMLMTSFGAIEEVLPLTDLVPTATICWCLTYMEDLQKVRNFLGLRAPVITVMKNDKNE